MNKKQFFDQYEIDIANGRLGGGAFGTVYKAYDHINSLWKAVKIGEVKYINGKAFSLISEYNAVKDLPAHRNIANYESVHQFHMPNGVFDYAIMQYYPEGNLKDLLKKNILNDQQKKEIAEGIINGIHYLHSNKILHRDIKPSNILIAKIKDIYTPKIADFGLSKFVDAQEMTEITNSFGGGTLEYSSPEQLRGHTLRYNADLWATGVILYEIFIGKIPFDSDSFVGSEAARRALIYQNIDNARIPDEITLCPYPFDQVIARCLVKDPNKRVQSADEILKILKQREMISEETEIISTPFVVAKTNNPDPDQTEVLSDEAMQQVIVKQEEEKAKVKREEEERVRKQQEEARKKQEAEEAERKRKEEELERKQEEERIRKQQEEARKKKEAEEAERKRKEEELKRKQEEERVRKQQEDARKKKEAEEAERKQKEQELRQRQKEEQERKKAAIVERKKKKEDRRKAFILWFEGFRRKLVRPVLAVAAIILLSLGANTIWNFYLDGPEIYEENGLFGFKDENGNIVVPALYGEVLPFKWGKATLFSDSIAWVIDKGGNIIDEISIDKSIDDIPIDQEELVEDQDDPLTDGESEISGNSSDPKKSDEPIASNSDKTTQDEQTPDQKTQEEILPPEINEADNTNLAEPESTEDVNKKIEETITDDFKSNDESTKTENSEVPINKEVDDKPIREEEAANVLNPKEKLTLNTSTPEFPVPDVIRTLDEKITFIPAGTFTLGCDNPEDDCEMDEIPRREVDMRAFYLSKYEITQKEFQDVMGYNPSYFQGCANCPVENVTWREVNQYITRLNAMPGNPYKFRLPTEIEWEYAARGGKAYIYAGSDNIDEVAEYKSNNGSGTVTVTRTKANDFGLRGMSGNVSEWCQDWYSFNSYKSETPLKSGTEKVIRGGSWNDRKRACRIKNRDSGQPELSRPTIGFRLVREKK